VFISEKDKKKQLIILLAYVGITAFIALFGFIYEQFSHGVYSTYMWFAWAWVFGFGLVPHMILYFAPIKKVPGLITGCIYNFGVAMVTVRSIFKGVIAIYGTTNDQWVLIYTILAIVFLVAGLVLYIANLMITNVNQE